MAISLPNLLQGTLQGVLPIATLLLLPGPGLVKAAVEHLMMATVVLIAVYETIWLLKQIGGGASATPPSLTSMMEKGGHAWLSTLEVSGIFHIIAILYGAPIFESWAETGMGSLFLGVVCALPGALMDGTSSVRIVLGFGKRGPINQKDAATLLRVGMVMFGAWLGAIAIPLDWDRDWQVWPVPCVVGGVIAHAIGSVGAEFLPAGSYPVWDQASARHPRSE